MLLADYWQGALPASATTWNLHTTQPKYFAPTYSEVVNLTGLAEYKGLNVCVEGSLFAVNESSRAVDLIADVKE